MSKKRLDQLVHEQYPHLSRTFIQSLVMQGKVTVDGRIITKPGVQVAPDAQVVVDFQEPQYVSRGGFKLEKALDHFTVDVRNLIALDAGLSTGGFTDCLLQRGAAKVYGVDVGHGQVHEKIRNDARVVLLENTNLRYSLTIPEQVDLVTLDLAFISVLKVMDTVVSVLKPTGHLVVLIKPQFEARKEQVGKGGVITDPVVHQQVINTVIAGIEQRGFKCLGWIESPIEGAAGNKEFLSYFKRIP